MVENLIGSGYRGEHALYHAALEAFHRVCRGQLELGNILRTEGLNFAVVRGLRTEECKDDGDWIAVALYGTIGAPVKGWEHETVYSRILIAISGQGVEAIDIAMLLLFVVPPL